MPAKKLSQGRAPSSDARRASSARACAPLMSGSRSSASTQRAPLISARDSCIAAMPLTP